MSLVWGRKGRAQGKVKISEKRKQNAGPVSIKIRGIFRGGLAMVYVTLLFSVGSIAVAIFFVVVTWLLDLW